MKEHLTITLEPEDLRHQRLDLDVGGHRLSLIIAESVRSALRGGNGHVPAPPPLVDGRCVGCTRDLAHGETHTANCKVRHRFYRQQRKARLEAAVAGNGHAQAAEASPCPTCKRDLASGAKHKRGCSTLATDVWKRRRRNARGHQ